MEARYLIKLSLIIDKMGIKDDLVNIETKTNEEVGKELIGILIANLHKAENEIYEFIAQYKEITVEEAQRANIIEILKEILKIDGLQDFLSQM